MLTGFEAMQIAGSRESRNDSEQPLSRRISIGNNESIYTELQFLLTGDLSTLAGSELTRNP
jgi:hypothetical protein